MRTLILYRFRYFDPPRHRWIQARYVLEAPAIRCRYPDYEIFGTAEIRHVADGAMQFSPFLISCLAERDSSARRPRAK
jgi:hypothetical protein